MTVKTPLGADLVLPVLAAAFAAYFFYDIDDLVWEAKANGVFIGSTLLLLVAVQFVRTAVAIVRGKGSLETAPLWWPREVLGRRLGMIAVTIVFIVTLPWLGLTLGLLLGMLAALWLMGVRRAGVLVGISATVAATAHLLFIAALDANFPRGPIENLVAALIG